MIHREDDEIYESLEVELLKKRERGLGLRYEARQRLQFCGSGSATAVGMANLDLLTPSFVPCELSLYPGGIEIRFRIHHNLLKAKQLLTPEFPLYIFQERLAAVPT